LWSLVRPRRVHLYGIGAPKSGTTSTARLFSESFRTAHEPFLQDTIELVRAKLDSSASPEDVRQQLRKRDRLQRYEVESNALLVYVAGDLAALFPSARFICTVRPPYDWLRSAARQHVYVSVDEIAAPNARSIRPALYHVLDPEAYPAEEAPLAEQGAWNVDAYLRFWCDHYRRALSDVPADRLLLLPTSRISSSLDRVAEFAGCSASDLAASKSHANRSRHSVDPLSEVYDRYVREKIEQTCRPMIDRLNERISHLYEA
jgi:hypothetical protein